MSRARAIERRAGRKAGKRFLAARSLGLLAASSRGRLRLASRGMPLEEGGMIAIGGPPLAGKGLLAARLAECLPDAIKLEAIDDLCRSDPYWLPEGPGRPAVSRPLGVMLARTVEIWSARRPGRTPTLLVATRFGTSAERRRAKAAARSAGMRFLFVEARSRDERALQRIPMDFLSTRELEARLGRYERALRRYQPVSRVETVLLPGVRLTRVVSNLEQAVGRVLGLWRGA